MSTGYTAPIAKGITFPEFAMNCAHAFGALISLRDEPRDAPVPDEFLPSDYHIKALEEAKSELSRIKSMSEAQAAIHAREEYDNAVAARETRIQEVAGLKDKYTAMIAEVEKWQPPTPGHQDLKDFMKQQIMESIEWDCYVPEDKIVLLSGREWLAKQIDRLRGSIQYHEKENAKEVIRCKSRTEWVRALRESLK